MVYNKGDSSDCALARRSEDTDIVMVDRLAPPPGSRDALGTGTGDDGSTDPQDGEANESPMVTTQVSFSVTQRSSSPVKVTRTTELRGSAGKIIREDRVKPHSKPVQGNYWEQEAQLLQKETVKLRSQVVGLEAKLAATAADAKTIDELRASLAEESSRREAVESDLRQKTANTKDAVRRWKQTARELNDLRSSAQGFYTVTDEYLKELATRLRFNIQNFAIQFFEGDASRRSKIEKTEYFKYYIEPVKDYNLYLFSRDRCPSIIQRFLWKVVVRQIFDNFRWAGAAADSARHLADLLRPENPLARASPSRAEDAEAERKFQRWSASMATLLAAVVDAEDDRRDRERLLAAKRTIFRGIDGTIRPLVRSQCEGFDQELIRIIDEAIVFDKELSRQLARVKWDFGDVEAGMAFDPNTMKLERGQMPTVNTKRAVCLVIEPAMVKRGTSTGEGYGTETVLLPMEVSAEPIQRGR